MTLFEAHKSERKYKRKAEIGFYRYLLGGQIQLELALVDDYELEPEAPPKLEAWLYKCHVNERHYAIRWFPVESEKPDYGPWTRVEKWDIP